MANNETSTKLPSVAALEAEAVARVEGLKRTAELLAARLAEVMQELHGGTWVSHLMHEPGSEFAIIRPKLDRPVNPKRGEVV